MVLRVVRTLDAWPLYFLAVMSDREPQAKTLFAAVIRRMFWDTETVQAAESGKVPCACGLDRL